MLAITDTHWSDNQTKFSTANINFYSCYKIKIISQKYFLNIV